MNEMGDALMKLTQAAERFVNRAPRQQRLEEDRRALLDAITHAQLVLSVAGAPAGRRRLDDRRAEGKKAPVTNLDRERRRRRARPA